jgi:Protein of unknown function (DUF2958)
MTKERRETTRDAQATERRETTSFYFFRCSRLKGPESFRMGFAGLPAEIDFQPVVKLFDPWSVATWLLTESSSWVADRWSCSRSFS